MEKMLKRVLINSFKVSFAGGLIYWLVQSGKIDMELVKESFKSPLFVALIVFLMLFDHGIVALRWRIILQFKATEKLNIVRIFLANWIGIFFNSVLPGAVTGDIIKIFYVKNEDKNLSKKFLLASVFLDRLVGLFGLILIGGITSTLFYDFLAPKSKELETLLKINFLLSGIVIFSFIFLYFFHKIPLKLSAWFTSKDILSGVMKKLEEMWNDLYMIKDRLIKVLIISMIIQSIAAVIFWKIVNQFTGDSFELIHAFSIYPIGMISLAIPVAPAGLGVGHVVFLKLFSFLGIENGANLFNVYFIYIIMVNLTGIIPYVFHQYRPTTVGLNPEDNADYNNK